MPFLQLGFSTRESAIQFQQNVNESLRRLHRPIRPLNALLNIRDWSSQKPCKRILYTFHVALLIILISTLLAVLLIEPYNIFVNDSSQSFVWIVYATYFLKIQGFISIFFVLIWNIKRKHQKFESILVETSSGAGCLRKTKRLRLINYTFLLYNLLRLVFSIGIAFLREFNRTPGPSHDTKEEETRWDLITFNVFTSVTCAIGQLVTFSIIIGLSGVMISEFEAVASDFRSDNNTYQLAVVTHYLFAYKHLLRLYRCLRGFLCAWMNLQLCFAYFQLFYVLSTIDLFDEFTGLALNLILFVDSTIIVITVCLLITRIDKALNGLCSAALSLSVSGKVLHEGTYPLLNTFAEYCRFKQRKIFFLCGMFTISAKKVIRFGLLISLFAIWNRLNYVSMN